MYFEIAKMLKEVVDVDFDVKYEDGAIEIDLKVKIPIALEIENAYKNLTS